MGHLVAGGDRDAVQVEVVAQLGRADEARARITALGGGEQQAPQLLEIEPRRRQPHQLGGVAVPLLAALELGIFAEGREAEGLGQVAVKQLGAVGRAHGRERLRAFAVDDEYARLFQPLAHPVEGAALAEASAVEVVVAPVDRRLDDRMVERCRRREQLGRRLRSAERGEHRVRRNAHRLQQPHQQERLVLAIAVAVLQHLGRTVRPVRTLAERDRDVANLRLHPLQRLRSPIGAAGQAQPLLHQRHQLGRQRLVGGEERLGPAGNLGPIGKLAELQRAQRERASRQHRLEFDGGDVMLLETQPAHAAAAARFGCQRGRRPVADPAPPDVAGLGHIERHPPRLHRHRSLPRHRLQVTRAEDGVRALDRIQKMQRVADAHVGQQHARRDEPAVDALLESGFTLQKAHRRGRGVIDDLVAAQDLDPVQHQPLVLRNELHRDLAELSECRGVVGLLRDVDEQHRLVGHEQMRIFEPDRKSASRRGRWRHRQHVGPSRQRRAAHERRGGDRDLAQRRRIGCRRRGLRRGSRYRRRCVRLCDGRRAECGSEQGGEQATDERDERDEEHATRCGRVRGLKHGTSLRRCLARAHRAAAVGSTRGMITLMNAFPTPPWTTPGELDGALRDRGYAVLAPGALRTRLQASAGDLEALLASWNELPPDAHLRDGGHYRRRRHSCFVLDPQAELRQVPHRAHWQPVEYNALHGGIERWFEPMHAELTAQPVWRNLLRHLGERASALRREQPWFVRGASVPHRYRRRHRPADAGGRASRRRRPGRGTAGRPRGHQGRRDARIRGRRAGGACASR